MNKNSEKERKKRGGEKTETIEFLFSLVFDKNSSQKNGKEADE